MVKQGGSETAEYDGSKLALTMKQGESVTAEYDGSKNMTAASW
jgi:hypothetical protein